MGTYADHLTLRDARAKFFAENKAVFGDDGGYDAKWVRIELGPLPIFIPNMAGRNRAVRLHDLHHIVTGYQTDIKGEAEIGAWEVGSGCGNFWHAWALNMAAFGLGLFIAPVRTFRAFVRGLRTDSLYHHHVRLEEALLDDTVGRMRERLQLSTPMSQAQPATARETAMFIWWAILSLIVAGSPVLVLLAIIAAVILIAR